MLATRTIRSCSQGRSKNNKAVLEPLPGDASMCASGGARSAIAAARMDVAEFDAASNGKSGGRGSSLKPSLSNTGRSHLPPLPTNLQSAAKGGPLPSKLPPVAERTAVASNVYGVPQSRQAPGAIKKLTPRVPSASRSLSSEVGGGIRRRKSSASACLRPLDSRDDRSKNASPEVPAVAPWERDLFSAAAKAEVRLDAAEELQAPTLATSPMSAPPTPAPSKPSPRRPPAMLSRPSPRLAVAVASPRPAAFAAAPKAATLAVAADVEQPTPRKEAIEKSPVEEAAKAHAQRIFQDMFAQELRVNDGDANAAAASALRRLAAVARR